jgi:hypothetical protein
MLGFVDVATSAGLDKHDEDIGQTFGKGRRQWFLRGAAVLRAAYGARHRRSGG